MGLLEQRGNAFDAAVATAFTLQVVEPHLNGPGGEAPFLLYHADTDHIEVVCGQGPAPRRATAEFFRSLGYDQIPGTGLLPACVAGSFDALMVILGKYGRCSLRQVLEPAIAYAGSGCPVVPRMAALIDSVAEHMRSQWPTSGAV